MREPMHYQQLHNVQTMIKGAGQHFQQRPRLLVERPISCVIRQKVIFERPHAAFVERMVRIFSGHEVHVVDTPQGPDKAVQNMRGWANNILFDPPVASRVRESDTAVIHGPFESLKRIPRCSQVVRVSRFQMCAEEQ